MVDKIDRPEIPPPYQITATKEATDEQRQGGQQQEEEGGYHPQGKDSWNKFHRQELVIKPVRVAKATIAECLFRHTTLRNGVPLVVVDIRWKNGQTTEGAHIVVTRREDYLKLSRFLPNQKVPDGFWGNGETIELGIPQAQGGSGSFRIPEYRQQQNHTENTQHRSSWLSLFGFIHQTTGKPRWGNILFTLFGLFVISMILFEIIRG